LHRPATLQLDLGNCTGGPANPCGVGAMTVDDLRAMLKPYDPDLMKTYKVSQLVNSVKNDIPECVAPLPR
jgi:hypothetical protein